MEDIIEALIGVSPVLIGGTVIIGLLMWALNNAFSADDQVQAPPVEKEPEAPPPKAKPVPTPKPAPKKKMVKQGDRPEVATVLKGHTDSVTGITFTPNGKHLASISPDRTLRLWPIKDFDKKGVQPVRMNIEQDHATHIAFTQDNRACVVALHGSNKLRLMQVSVKSRTCEKKVDIPEKPYSHAIVGCGIHAANPHDPRSGISYVACATATTGVEIRTVKGDLLESIDTKSGHHNFLTTSPDGKFIAVCGGVGDAKVFAAPRTAGSKCTKAFSCGKHSSEVYHCAFSSDMTLCATVSKDGTWKVWDITIDWDRGGDPKLVASGSYTVHEGTAFIAISPDNRVVAVASGRTLSLFAVRTLVGKEIEDTHPRSRITGLAFDAEGKYVATSGTDKAIVIWHNTVGHEESAFHFGQELKRATGTAAKERIQVQLDAARAALAMAQ